MRYLVRPRKLRRTPFRLRDALGFQRSYAYPNMRDVPVFSWESDFLIAVPSYQHVRYAPDAFNELRRVYVADKWKQRLWLTENGLPTPLDADQPEDDIVYVRRPLRHRSGIEFECIPSESVIPMQELIAHNNTADNYLSPLFRRTHEYRIILHKGKTVWTILKRQPEHLTQTQAWNGANGSYFVTVRNPDNNRLRHTDIYERLENNPVLASAHLLGVDVLLNHPENKYAISEINFCPSIEIDSNIEELRSHVENQH